LICHSGLLKIRNLYGTCIVLYFVTFSSQISLWHWGYSPQREHSSYSSLSTHPHPTPI
jgi:hypothetical protein